MRAVVVALVVATVAALTDTPDAVEDTETERRAASASSEHWRICESEQGRFRVELPEETRLERSRGSTLFGAVRDTKYALRFGDAQMAVEVHDIPRIASRVVPARVILERTRAGVLKDMNAVQIEAGELTLLGYPALDFTYRVPEDPPLYERAIAVLVESRIYLLTGMAPASPTTHPAINRFFASFHFWRKGHGPPDAPLESRPGPDCAVYTCDPPAISSSCCTRPADPGMANEPDD